MARKKQEMLVLFPEVIAITRKFTDKQFGILMRAAFAYRFSGEMYTGDDAAVDVAFQAVVSQIDRYREFCETQSRNAKGNEEHPSAANVSQSQPSTPPIQSMSNPCPIQSKESIGADKPPNSHPKEEFVKPSVEEVTAYCQENGYAIDASRFVDFYESNGWRVGKSPMRSWQAAVRNWARREQQKKGAEKQSLDLGYGGMECSL